MGRGFRLPPPHGSSETNESTPEENRRESYRFFAVKSNPTVKILEIQPTTPDCILWDLFLLQPRFAIHIATSGVASSKLLV